MESGHAKNVVNFETVTIILIALGAAYNPAQALILLAAVQTKLAEAKPALAAVDAAQADKTVKPDEVQAEFDGLYKYVVNVKRSVEVEINDPAFTNDIQSLVNEFASSSRKTGLTDDPLAPRDESRSPVSTSQRSRDNQIGFLGDIIALLHTKNYKSNDAEFDLPAIEAKQATLTAKNNAAKASIAALGNAQDERDRILSTTPNRASSNSSN
ncbi:MAG TPA: hypothetical protein VGC97_22445 [Pyrinomonadaceae bacterium]|jgi:hypothetical protein